MQIRQERPGDATGIRLTTDAAFRDMPYSNQTEAKIVDALRSSGALAVSLVASHGDEIIGHAAFSPVRINSSDCGWYGLGPVSVRPDQQRRGIGQLLIRGGLRQLQSLRAAGCVVFGNPAYYGRFGFESDPGLFYDDAPLGLFQRLVLRGDAPKGEVTYHPSFAAA
jgi:putative acetyltransferase